MENCWEQPPQSSQDYYPHYNLFQSSIFYDTDNFRVSYLSYRYDDCSPTESGTRCCEEVERSAEPPDKPAEAQAAATPAPGTPEPRVVTKEELYDDPDLFGRKDEHVQAASSPAETPILSDSCPWGYDWTKQSWVKAGRGAVVMPQNGERKDEWKNKQKLYKQLANAPKVSNSKAETMMQKMGWQGGALGKTSKGIVEPVTPDPQYGASTAGFGQRAPPPPPPRGRRPSRRDAFRTNVLLHVLRFVQDDTEIELFFDEALRQHERRFIHTLVHSVINDRNVVSLSTVAQYDLVADVARVNQYELGTVSDGDPPHRQMCIYKEAPEHVYLVTPDDLQPKQNTAAEPNAQGPDSYGEGDGATKPKNADAKDETNKTDEETANVDDDENPFLKSIKKSIKRDEPKNISNKFEKDCNIAKEEPAAAADEPSDAETRMLDFFLEFAEAKAYEELRFLGKFNPEQMGVVNELLNELAACIGDAERFEGRKEIADVVKKGKVRFELKEGVNGTTEIHKLPPART